MHLIFMTNLWFDAEKISVFQYLFFFFLNVTKMFTIATFQYTSTVLLLLWMIEVYTFNNFICIMCVKCKNVNYFKSLIQSIFLNMVQHLMIQIKPVLYFTYVRDHNTKILRSLEQTINNRSQHSYIKLLFFPLIFPGSSHFFAHNQDKNVVLERYGLFKDTNFTFK